MSEEERLSLNNYMADLYQAMQIGDIVYEPKHSSELYNLINKLLKENQKYKEVINKAIALLEDDNICADIRRNKPIDDNRGLPFPKCIVEYGVEKELLSILKEVEHEKIND